MMKTIQLQPGGTMPRTRRRAAIRGGFSLIEVTLAVGIIAFAMLTLVALLPIGISANRAAAEQARAAQTVNAIALAIRSAKANPLPGSPNPSGTITYTAAAPFSALWWQVKTPPNTNTTNIDFYLNE